MDVKNLDDFILVEKKSQLIKDFSENLLETFPHLETGERIIKYLNYIDCSLPTQKVVANEAVYNLVSIETKVDTEEYYLINIIEDKECSKAKGNTTTFENEFLDDYLDEYDVYDSYNDRISVFAQTLVKMINGAKKIIIMGHRYPDLDSFASSLGIYWFVKFIDSHKPCHIVLDESTSSISALYDKVILENGFSEAVIDEEQGMSFVDDDTLLIVVDVDNSDIVASTKVFSLCKEIVVLDHHRKSSNSINATVKMHVAYASSTSELVTKIIKTLCSSTDISSFLAEALLAGITIDTKSFAFQTTFETFETAGFLKQVGVNSKRVRQLLQSKLVDYRTKAKIVNSVNIYNENIAISVVNLRNETNPKLIIAMVADELLNLVGVEVSFVIAQVDKDVFVSARSLGLNVAKIMAVFGGGGHLTVAAAIIQNSSTSAVKQQILDMLQKKKLQNLSIK